MKQYNRIMRKIVVLSLLILLLGLECSAGIKKNFKGEKPIVGEYIPAGKGISSATTTLTSPSDTIPSPTTTSATSSTIVDGYSATIKVTAGGNPVEGIRVWLYRNINQYTGIVGYTDENGEYTAEDMLADTGYRWRIRYQGVYNYTNTFNLPPDNHKTVDYPIGANKATVTVTQDGNPLGNIQVWLYKDSTRYTGITGRTDANGEYISEGLLDGVEYRWRLYYLGDYNFTQTFNLPPDNTQTFDYPMGQYKATIKVFADGNPLSNVYVRLYKNTNRYTGIYGYTDTNGEYTVEELSSGVDYRWRITYQGTTNYTNTFNLPPDNTQEYDYPQGTNTATIKVTQNNQPLTNIRVWLYKDTTAYTGITGRTDTNGEYTADNLLAGSDYRWRTYYQGNYNYTNTFNLPPDNTQEYDYPTGNNKATIKVTVDGTPESDVRVWLYKNNYYTGKTGYTDENGLYTAIDLMGGSEYRWRIMYQGDYNYTSTFNLPPDNVQNIDYTRGANKAKVKVTLDGMPMQNIQVWLYKDTTTYTGITGRTDTNGEYYVEELLSGSDYRFRAYYLGDYKYTNTFNLPPDSSTTINFEGGTSKATVKVTLGGSPLENAYVRLYKETNRYTGKAGYTDSNGEFTAENLTDGVDYRWRISYQGVNTYTDTFNLPPDNSQTYDIEYSSNTATIRILENNNPLENMRVWLYRDTTRYTGATGLTDLSGEFEATNILSGTNFRWRIRNQGVYNYTGTFDMPPDNLQTFNY
jgi:uncharacterized GH25 family protein